MSYIGLDISLTATGVVYIKDGTSESKLITTTPKGFNRPEYRLDHISGSIKNFIKPHKDLQAISIEGLSYGSKGTVKDQFGYLHYDARIYCVTQLGLDPIVVPPKTLKKWTVGNGNASKEDMVAGVNERWGTQIIDDNIADAYALAKYAEEWHQREVSDDRDM